MAVLASAVAATVAALAVLAGALVFVNQQEAGFARIQSQDRELLDAQTDGQQALNKNDLPRALGIYREVVKLAEDLIRRQPSDPQWRLNLAVGHENLGYALEASGNVPMARAEYARALTAAHECAKLDGKTPQVSKDRATLQGEVQADLKRLASSNRT
jgi:tetratricopeptide (TPR) repeat protein